MEPTPNVHLADWRFTVDGMVETPTTWTWDEINAQPPSVYAGDIHCVTSWSMLGKTFGGVSLDPLLDAAAPVAEASHVLITSSTGYTTNLPLDDVRSGKAWIAFTFEGEPLTPDHGGPARLLVPHLYFWKSAKWIRRITVLNHDEAGFWERNGYHDRGDPWKEQRFLGD